MKFKSSLITLALLIFSVATSLNSHAYTTKDFVCPLKKPELKPLMSTLYPEIFRKDGDHFRVSWSKRLEQDIPDEPRIKIVNELYVLAEKSIKESIDSFIKPNAEVDGDPKMSSFFDRYTTENNSKLNRKGELRKRDAHDCRKAALQELHPGMPTPIKSDAPLSTSKEPHDPMKDLSEAIAKTCFGGMNFASCINEMSKATLMCTPTSKRAAFQTEITQSFGKFRTVIQDQARRLAQKPKHESHYQIRLLLSMFPSLSNQYLRSINDQSLGDVKLQEFSDKISRNEELSAEEYLTTQTIIQSISQICRTDFLMDVRKVLSDVVTYTSIGITVAGLALGPTFGLILLPSILSSGATLGFLIGLNVLSGIMSVIDASFVSRDMRVIFQEGKISLLLFHAVRYQKQVMDNVFRQIKVYHSEALSKELTLHDEKVARKLLLEVLHKSNEVRELEKLYRSLKTANFNRAKQIINLITFGLTLAPTINYSQALYSVLADKTLSTGRETMAALGRLRGDSPWYSGLTNTNTAIDAALTGTSLGYAFQNLTKSQLAYVREALESAFGFSP